MKRLLEALAFCGILPILVLYECAARLAPQRREKFFQSASQSVSLLPNFIGVSCRKAVYRHILRSCADSVRIEFGTLFSKPEAEIGEHVYIGPNCMIGLVSIGADTLVGSNVDIPSGKKQHNFEDPTQPMRIQGGSITRVNIGADVWLGNSCVVMADVGDHAIVAAGAVVIDPVEPWSIVGGNPAREISRRNRSAPA